MMTLAFYSLHKKKAIDSEAGFSEVVLESKNSKWVWKIVVLNLAKEETKNYGTVEIVMKNNKM